MQENLITQETPRLSARTTKAGMIFAAGLATAGLLSSKAARAVSPALTFANIPPFTPANATDKDIKVLNYALALETFEADLYRQALQRLTTGGTNRGAAFTGLNLSASEPDVQYVTAFAQVEADHRDFLKAALGSAAITATGQPLAGATFDFNIGNLDRGGILDLLYTVENTGVQAYLGAITSFGTKTYLAVAGGIQATEARHTAVIAAVSNQLFQRGRLTAPQYNQNNGIDNYTLTPDQVLAAVSPNIFLAGT